MSETDTTPVIDDHARIDALEHLVAQQEQSITEIERTLANVANAGLSESDIPALEWLKEVRRMLTFGAQEPQMIVLLRQIEARLVTLEALIVAQRMPTGAV